MAPLAGLGAAAVGGGGALIGGAGSMLSGAFGAIGGMQGLGTIAQMAGPIMGGLGSFQQGGAAVDVGKAQQAAFNYNASLELRRAKLERARAINQADQHKREGQEIGANQRLGYAKARVLSTTGTSADFIDYTKELLDADLREIRKEGYLAEYFAKSTAEDLYYRGRLAKAGALNQQSAQRQSGIGSILTGAGQGLPLLGSIFGGGGGGAVTGTKSLTAVTSRGAGLLGNTANFYK